MPVFFVLGVLINLGITSSPGLALQGFAQIAVRPASFANYSRDPADLIFPAIDPEIIQDANNDALNFGLGEAPLNPAATPAQLTNSATPNPTSTSPFGPSTPTQAGPTSTPPTNPTSTLQASPTPTPELLSPLDPIIDPILDPIIDPILEPTPTSELLPTPTCFLLCL
jgi:hypothetical protein